MRRGLPLGLQGRCMLKEDWHSYQKAWYAHVLNLARLRDLRCILSLMHFAKCDRDLHLVPLSHFFLPRLPQYSISMM